MLITTLLNICVITAFIYLYNDGRTFYKHFKYMIKRTIKCSNYDCLIHVLFKTHNKYLRKYFNW